MTIANVIPVYEAALRAAKNHAPEPLENAPERTLEVLFYGMMCFDPLEDGSGYRVFFPNGVDLPALVDIPVHTAGVWVRDRSASAIARWSGFAFRNDFFLTGKHKLTVTGLSDEPLNTEEFEGRVTNLQKCEPTFKIHHEPDAVIEMLVDRGTLSAHKVKQAEMIVVKWTVQVKPGVPVRFTFGDDFIEIPPSVKQVYLANVSASTSDETLKHFQLYRMLAADPSKPLLYKGPEIAPTSILELNDPTFGYMPPADIAAITPDVVCSAVVSRLKTPKN